MRIPGCLWNRSTSHGWKEVNGWSIACHVVNGQAHWWSTAVPKAQEWLISSVSFGGWNLQTLEKRMREGEKRLKNRNEEHVFIFSMQVTCMYTFFITGLKPDNATRAAVDILPGSHDEVPWHHSDRRAPIPRPTFRQQEKGNGEEETDGASHVRPWKRSMVPYISLRMLDPYPPDPSSSNRSAGKLGCLRAGSTAINHSC